MKAQEFKTAIAEAKDLLKGKTLTIDFVNGNIIQKMQFQTLKGFGETVLKLEKLGAGFGFIKVGNSLTQKGIYKPEEFIKVLSKGVWNEVFFLATTVKA